MWRGPLFVCSLRDPCMGSTEERREKAKAFVRYSCCQGGGGEKGFWNMSWGKIYDMGLLAYVGKSYVGWVGGGGGGGCRERIPPPKGQTLCGKQWVSKFLYVLCPLPPPLQPKIELSLAQVWGKYIHSWVSRGSRVQKGELCMPAQSPQMYVRKGGGELRSAKKKLRIRGFANIKQEKLGRHFATFQRRGRFAWVKGMS